MEGRYLHICVLAAVIIGKFSYFLTISFIREGENILFGPFAVNIHFVHRVEILKLHIVKSKGIKSCQSNGNHSWKKKGKLNLGVFIFSEL